MLTAKMVEPHTAKFPPPKSWDEFEDMVSDAMSLLWDDPHAKRHGSGGQRQHGIDIRGRPKDLTGGWAAVQCKNIETTSLELVVSAAEKATEITPPISRFIYVCAAKRDAKLDTVVYDHFHVKPAPFEAVVLYWDDIVALLTRSHDLIRKYYGSFLGAEYANATTVPRPAAPAPWRTGDIMASAVLWFPVDREGASRFDLTPENWTA